MAMTNAERQRKYRQGKLLEGLFRKDTWTNSKGLLSPKRGDGNLLMMNRQQFYKQLKELISGLEDFEQDLFYAEIFEYAKRVKAKL